ncbi:MAG: RNA methyltransferase [Bdellovibrionota bacterium]
MDFNKIKTPIDVRVVLVRPIYERNIGATSRAMANMGFSKMILIAPQCEITFEAQQAAATGQDGLQNRVTYSSWADFFQHEPQGLRLAFTAKDGRGRAVQDFKETLNWLTETSPYLNGEHEGVLPIHLIFGPEDWGLSSDDIKESHFNCSLPTYGENSSLNLAQATLLALFVLRDTWGGVRTVLDGQQPPKASRELPNVFPDETLRVWLTEMGFDITNHKVNVYSVLKRLMLQNTPTPKEYQMLETVLQQSIRKLHEYNQMRKTTLERQ